MKYFYLTFQQTVLLGSIMGALGVVWIGGVHDFNVVDTALGIFGVVVLGLFMGNLTEGLKRAGKKLHYTNLMTLAKIQFMGLVLTLSLLYICEIPYDQDYLSYGLIVGALAAGHREYQVRQARGLKIHFDVTLLNDGTYSIGTNSTTTEVQEGVRDLSAQRLQDPKELVGKLHTILGTYENRSPEDDQKDIEVTIDCMRV